MNLQGRCYSDASQGWDHTALCRGACRRQGLGASRKQLVLRFSRIIHCNPTRGRSPNHTTPSLYPRFVSLPSALPSLGIGGRGTAEKGEGGVQELASVTTRAQVGSSVGGEKSLELSLQTGASNEKRQGTTHQSSHPARPPSIAPSILFSSVHPWLVPVTLLIHTPSPLGCFFQSILSSSPLLSLSRFFSSFLLYNFISTFTYPSNIVYFSLYFGEFPFLVPVPL